MHTAAGGVRWHKPGTYQEVNGSRKIVSRTHARKGAQFSFRLAACDRSNVDTEGHASVTGQTSPPDFPTKNAFQNQPNTPDGTAFVIKVSAKSSKSSFLAGPVIGDRSSLI